MTRAEARKQGLSHYYTGKPCKHGHTSRRRTRDANCLSCAAESQALRREKKGRKKKPELSELPTSRQEALRLGETHYFTGTPCTRGHLDRRYSLDGACLSCSRIHKRNYVARNPERAKKVAAAQNKRWAKANPERRKYLSLLANRRRQGLPEPTRPTPDACECCGRPRSSMTREIHLDHDHLTGTFRGWLCSLCNTGIGALGDTLAGLRQAVAYLERSEA